MIKKKCQCKIFKLMFSVLISNEIKVLDFFPETYDKNRKTLFSGWIDLQILR